MLGLRIFLSLIFAFVSFESQVIWAEDRRVLTDSDSASWNDIGDVQLDPHGKWLAYLLTSGTRQSSLGGRAPGMVIAVLRSTHGNTERRFELGARDQGAGSVAFSRTGRWMAMLKARLPDVVGDFESINPAAKTDLLLVEVATGRERLYRDVCAFEFMGGPDDRIVTTSYPNPPASTGFNLTVERLNSSERLVFSAVETYSINLHSGRLAWASADEIAVLDPDSDQAVRIDSTAGRHYTRLAWSPKGGALAALGRNRAVDDVIVTFTGFETKHTQKRVFEPRTWKGFPDGFKVVDEEVIEPFGVHPVLAWRNDETGVFFSIKRRPIPKRLAKESPVGVALWHSASEKLPDQIELEVGRSPIHLSFVSIADGRFIQLSDDQLTWIDIHAKARYLLAFDTKPYGWRNPSSGTAAQVRDYYFVDIRTGRRRLAMKSLPVVRYFDLSISPQLSPDGSILLYQDENGDYISRDVDTAKTRNLTNDLPVKFFFPENDPKTQRYPRYPEMPGFPVLQGWITDGSAVLISDYYDVWLLPLRTAGARKLTASPKGSRLVFQVFSPPNRSSEDVTDEFSIQESRLVDTNRPIYFSTLDLRTGAQGLAMVDSMSASARVLYSEDASLSYFKAELTDTFICARGTSVDYPDFYLVGQDWVPTIRLTEANPQQRDFVWPPKSRYVPFLTAHGDQLHAVLYLPSGYVAGTKYPTIVQVYESAMGAHNWYIRPDEQSIFRWLRQGYAVLTPDIRPRFNDGGVAALEAVTAAVDAAHRVGGIDRERLALMGHSHGGYETYFIISQTALFRAAIAEAGVTDLISSYGEIRKGGVPNSQIMETHQSYLSGPWWENWEAYLRNSPLFHAAKITTPLLIAHGDLDSAVPFTQAVEMFNTLRRMGNKKVVLLQYVGEEHTFSSVAQRDIERRSTEFLNHLLKDEPPPKWWADGLSSAMRPLALESAE